ncbi:MAG: flagellar motor protein MotB [Rhodobacterales bacterium]|nr:flagellar motor protein MotB [Rhodobacterales bacterium]
MAAQSNVAPIIIKRKKVIQGGGHHGGAWKVAYADFVTAMMAFFLLMWLLNATTEKQRKGVADYFSPTVAISRVSGGGEGAFGGDSVFSEETLPQNGTGASAQRPAEAREAQGQTGVSSDGNEGAERAKEDVELKAMESALLGRAGESDVAKEILRHIVTRVTDEGLVIELFDLPGAELFRDNTNEPTVLLEDLARMIANVTNVVENSVAVAGYVTARPVVLESNPVWRLSTERANQMRVLLQEQGMSFARIQRVTGHADRKPVVRNPMAVRNNRIEVILLRSEK